MLQVTHLRTESGCVRAVLVPNFSLGSDGFLSPLGQDCITRKEPGFPEFQGLVFVTQTCVKARPWLQVFQAPSPEWWLPGDGLGLAVTTHWPWRPPCSKEVLTGGRGPCQAGSSCRLRPTDADFGSPGMLWSPDEGTNGAHFAVPASLSPREGEQGWGGRAAGSQENCWLLRPFSHPLPKGEIISCHSHRQITGNCSSPNYLVLIGD